MKMLITGWSDTEISLFFREIFICTDGLRYRINIIGRGTVQNTLEGSRFYHHCEYQDHGHQY